MGMYDVDINKKTGFERVSAIFGTVGSVIFESIESIVIALAISIVLYLTLITPHQVDGQSMMPTFRNQEHIIANKIIYKLREPRRGDVIIFKHSPTEDYIKRVIGVAGDEIAIIDGHVYINNEQLDESDYLADTVRTMPGPALPEGQPFTVPAGHIFVMGDNRPHSTDSRVFGPVELEAVKGEVIFVYFPFNNMRIITGPHYNLN